MTVELSRAGYLSAALRHLRIAEEALQAAGDFSASSLEQLQEVIDEVVYQLEMEKESA